MLQFNTYFRIFFKSASFIMCSVAEQFLPPFADEIHSIAVSERSPSMSSLTSSGFCALVNKCGHMRLIQGLLSSRSYKS